MMLHRFRFILGWVALLVLSQPALAAWQALDLNDVDIDIVSDRHGRSLPQYPVEQRHQTYRAYLEATSGAEYSIRVRNRSNQRIGLVIAVDGRNIISGDRSELRPNERMYILGPREQGTYRGWRTSRNQVNRFYFTQADDSYSGRWGDYSAMGVIAVAAYAEKRPRYEQQFSYRDSQPGAESSSAAPRKHAPAEPGTGFGEQEWSPSRRVEFKPESPAFARYFIKYEWRESLCDLGVIRCGRDTRTNRHNRMWNDTGFAPQPPGYGYGWRRN